MIGDDGVGLGARTRGLVFFLRAMAPSSVTAGAPQLQRWPPAPLSTASPRAHSCLLEPALLAVERGR